MHREHFFACMRHGQRVHANPYSMRTCAWLGLGLGLGFGLGLGSGLANHNRNPNPNPNQVTSWDLLVALSLTLLAVGWFFFTRPPAGAM